MLMFGWAICKTVICLRLFKLFFLNLQVDSGRDSDSSDDPDVRRSVITGKRIMMSLDRTNEDHARERGRKQLLQFMNSQF